MKNKTIMSFEDYESENIKNIMDKYDTYEQYLDDFISDKDIEYLGNRETAR